MDQNPFTIEELIDVLSKFPKNEQLRFYHKGEQLFFYRFDSPSKNVQVMELDSPDPE